MDKKRVSFIFRIKIAGEAGDGIMTAGDLLMMAAARQGYETSVAKSFPSNIRGGYAQSLVTISDHPVVSPLGDPDILFALSEDAFMYDTAQLCAPILILVESTALKPGACRDRRQQLHAGNHQLFAIPVRQFARETAGSCTIRSTVALGILCKHLGIRKNILDDVLIERFSRKGEETMELNRIALESGLLWAQQHLTGVRDCTLFEPVRPRPDRRLVLDGNQAVALGALHAGCSFYTSYPITPATAIGETLACELPSHGGFAYQAEDEIAALGAAIGASFCGAKAMTATSGPGLSLMQEFIGYASMVELPVVIVDVQRAGPSTGMPTKHSQDDLLAAVFGGHGESQRIVIAPAGVADCFHAAVDAFNNAERYQCPVLLLSDSTLAMTRSTIERQALGNPPVVNRSVHTPGNGPLPYHRYSGVNSAPGPIAVPGISSVTYRATGVEHTENSTPVAKPEERTAQMQRRHRKLLAIEHEFNGAVISEGDPDDGRPFDIGICAWGLTASITREAVAALQSQGYRITAIYPRLLFPVCTEAVNRWARQCSRQVVVEANFNGQYHLLLKMHTDARPHPFTVSRGEPFTPAEIEGGIKAFLEQENGRS